MSYQNKVGSMRANCNKVCNFIKCHPSAINAQGVEVQEHTATGWHAIGPFYNKYCKAQTAMDIMYAKDKVLADAALPTILPIVERRVYASIVTAKKVKFNPTFPFKV